MTDYDNATSFSGKWFCENLLFENISLTAFYEKVKLIFVKISEA